MKAHPDRQRFISCWPRWLRRHWRQPAAQAADDLVLGGSFPPSGVFAFCQGRASTPISDYVKIINEQGIKGLLRYVPERHGLQGGCVGGGLQRKSPARTKVNFYYGAGVNRVSKTIAWN